MSYLTFDEYNRHKRIFSEILDDMSKNGPRWKSGEDVKHLRERKKQKHIPSDMNMEQYNSIIMRLVSEMKNKLILHYDGLKYVVSNGKWIVIIHPKGEVETCFPPDNCKTYLSRRGYQVIGKLEEVFNHVGF